MWNLRQQAKVSGLGLLGGSQPAEASEAGSGESTIDATTDDGISMMQSRGLPVKMIPAGSI